jgi:probable HAF family extracellular repeat protein
MKTNLAVYIRALIVIVALTMPHAAEAQSNATPNQKNTHHHYVLYDLGTFGGAASYANEGSADGFYSNPLGSKQGIFTGWSETTTPDPNGPLFCFNPSCQASHAFQWQNGVEQDLGVLPGGLSSATNWVSGNGLIVGTSQNGEFDPFPAVISGHQIPGWPENRAVLWQNGNLIDLGTLPEGGNESGAVAVNNAGQVTGWAINTVRDRMSMSVASFVYYFYEGPFAYQMRTFVWQNGVMEDIGTLGGPDALPMGMNELGQVIGISYTNSTANSYNGCNPGVPPITPTQDPFIWEKGIGMTDLGSLGGTCGYAMGINNKGQVAGFSNLAGDQFGQAFLWDRANGMVNLGSLGGGQAAAYAINDAGEVVGGSVPGDGATWPHAFLWKGSLQDLGVLAGDNCSWSYWVNASGQIVGNGGTDCEGRGFLWENSGPMVDLNSLVISTGGFSVTDAGYINDQGEIIGQGTPSGCSDQGSCGHVYVMIPCDARHPGISGCDYSPVEISEESEAKSAQGTRAPGATASERKLTPAETTARFRNLMMSRYSRSRAMPN